MPGPATVTVKVYPDPGIESLKASGSWGSLIRAEPVAPGLLAGGIVIDATE